MPCRINRRREWTTRIKLESLLQLDNSFVTLTYDEEHKPADGSLSRADYRAFTKTLGFRYFGCGEYGSKTFRPHYHFVIFGMSPGYAEWINDRWGKGLTTTQPFVWEHAGYIAGYVTKKMTSCHDPRLQGRYPEFATMSRRPAIGTGAVNAIAARSLKNVQEILDAKDVSKNIRMDGKVSPIGQTLHRKLRANLSIPDSWKASRGAIAVDWALRSADYPELLDDLEARRVTQAFRAESLAKTPKGEKL